MRIRHVIPTVGSSAPGDLVSAQELTLHSVERALRCTSSDIEVEVRAVRFPDEPLDVDWITDLPILERSVLDLADFEVPRRLPLLSDVLGGFGDHEAFDVAVFSNVDIAVQPYFYDLVAELRRDGSDAVSITRRTVHARHRGSGWASLAAQLGSHHPGDDCFVIGAELLPLLHPVDAALGVRWVARCLLWQLMVEARSYRHAGDLHATFHLGDDRAWADPRLADYGRFNEQQALALLRRLSETHGLERIRRLPTTEPFVRAIELDTAAVVPPPTRTPPIRQGDRPSPGGEVRLVFSANPGRSGSQYLAELLGSADRVSAGHEREPAMAGGWLRRISYDDPMRSYDQRRVKADAIRAELGLLPANWTYVDSSHMFVKTFADVVLDEFQHERISVVVLRRDPLLVAKSFFELDYLGPVRPQWIDWMTPPTAPWSTFHLDHGEIRSQFDLIFGYLVDVEVRTQRLRQRSPMVRWIDVRLEEISRPEGARNLLRRLELSGPSDLHTVTATQVNRKEEVKRGVKKHVTIDHVRERWADFCDRFGQRDALTTFIDAYGAIG